MCIIHFGTLDNTFSFYIGCSDWHHEVFLLPTKRRVSGPLSPTDKSFLWDKYPDAGHGAVCDLCVRSARPSAFFSRRSSSTSSSAPQSMDSGLQVPSAPLVVSGAATSLATESVVEPSVSVAESSTAATGSATGYDGQKVSAKPSRPDNLKKAKQPRMLKTVTIAQRVYHALFSTLFTWHMTLVADQNIEGQQCFNGRPVCNCLLVAGFVGAWKNEFPSRLTTAGLQDSRTGDRKCLNGN